MLRPHHLRIPTGFSQPAQGCAAGATLGIKPKKPPRPGGTAEISVRFSPKQFCSTNNVGRRNVTFMKCFRL
jgi:hypothetical protein